MEIQRAGTGADPHRARYPSSVLDVENLDAGQPFRELPDTYVIFITEKDIFSLGKAENGGFEVYLEVTAKKFSTYVANIAEPDEWHTFAFDPAYQEYTVANELELEDSPEYDQNGTPVWYIKSAKIGKVLYNAEKQRFIFWALGVSDGGRASTGVFHNFFNRFQVEPNEYAATADTPRLSQPLDREHRWGKLRLGDGNTPVF